MRDFFGKILHWVYCLDLPDAALLMILFSAVFLVLKAYLGEKHCWKPVVGALLTIGVAAIIYVTIGNRSYGNIVESSLIPFHSYREVMNGGSREILRSNFMNALLFYPAGLLAASLLPKKWHPVWRVVLVTVVFAALSTGIEYVQYTYALGRVEIDDVIHNALGALLGGLVGCVTMSKNTRRRHGSR